MKNNFLGELREKIKKIVDGKEIFEAEFDGHYDLKIGSADDVHLWIFSNFDLVEKGRSVRVETKQLEQLRGLRQVKIRTTSLSDDGSLTLEFDDDRQIIVSSSQNKEAWILRRFSDDTEIICGLGGQMDGTF